jgi:hypothetical protein
LEGNVVLFEDGRTADIIGAHLVFGENDSIQLSDVIIAASVTSLQISGAEALKPPVMSANLTMSGQSFGAAMTLHEYNQIVVASTIRPNLENSGKTRLFSSPAAALAGAVQRKFGKCCGG